MRVFERVARHLNACACPATMNTAFIEQLGAAGVPLLTEEERFTSTLAVSVNGDVALLTSEGDLKFGSLRGSNNSLTTLEVFGLSKEEALGFKSLEFSRDGNVLLLWSSDRVGFLEMAIVSGGPCTYTNIWSITMVADGLAYPIAKAAFHPLCSHCVVLLHEQGGLRLIDLRSLNDELITMPAGRGFRSFAFGPSIEWLRFSILLLANDGNIYAVCPVVPAGTVVPTSTVAELWGWADQLSYENRSQSRTTEEYVTNLYEYLLNTFGPRPGPDDEYEGPKFVRAGEYTSPAWSGASDHSDGTSSSIHTPANYLPMLIGPISVQRSPTAWGETDEEPSAEGKHDGHQRQGAYACDIAVPNAAAGGAPVLIVSYANGSAEICMFDVSQPAAGGRNTSPAVRSPSYLGPCWKSIDHTRPNLACSAAGLLSLETVPVGGRSGGGAGAAGEFWRLQADPVYSHLVHVSCATRCEAHLLYVTWLEKTIADDADLRSVQSSERNFGESAGDSEAPAMVTPTTDPTRVLPVFVLPPSEAGSKGTQEAKVSSSRHSGGASAALSAAVVVQDAMLGHVALFRSTAGVVSAVNLTVHTKLCDLQDSTRNHTHAPELLPLKEELGRATSADHIRWRRTQQCIQKVAEGLRAMPEMDTATAAALTPQPSPHNKKVLLEAAQRLERDVLVPLNELAQTTMFSYEMVQETYRSQLDILEGSTTATAATTAATTAAPSGTLSQGLRKLVHSLEGDHDALSERVRKIQDKFASQREQAERLLACAVSQRNKMTRAENQYKQQLEQWSGVVSQMNEQVMALRVLSSAPQPPSATTPIKATPSSPRPPQPPLFSTTTTNNATSSPAAVSSRFARPAAFAPRTPYTPGSTAPGSTPSKQPSTTGRSTVFQTPQTPGAFKSPTGQPYRPYSTPSASSPTPVGSTAPTGAGAATGDRSSGTFNRRYHTRPPSVAASSPNFYSAYKASQQQGSVAGATAAGSAAKVAPPSPSPSQASSQSATVSLSEEDQEACMELLVSQTQLLEKAQKELSALENKIRAVKEERKGLVL